MPIIQIPGGEIAEVMQRRVEQADIDIHTPPGRARAENAGDQREGGHQPRHHIHDRNAEARGRPLRLAGQRQIPGLRLHQVIIARPGFPGSRAPVRAEMRADDAWVRVLQRVVRQAQFVRLVATQIVHHRIGLSDQAAQDAQPFGVLQVQRQAALAAIERLMEMTVAGAEIVRPDGTADIAAFRRVFDFDDLGAEIGEQHAAERPGAILLDRQHRHAIQRQRPRIHQMRFRSIRRRAMTRRWISLVPSPITSSGASR